jgi:hypothetical protein
LLDTRHMAGTPGPVISIHRKEPDSSQEEIGASADRLDGFLLIVGVIEPFC